MIVPTEFSGKLLNGDATSSRLRPHRWRGKEHVPSLTARPVYKLRSVFIQNSLQRVSVKQRSYARLLSETHYVGEIGLDGSRQHRATLAKQREVFKTILNACEAAGGRVMTVHSRGATSLVLDYLERFDKAGLPVLHWFSGTQTELRRAIELGCWFSVGPAMLQAEKGRRLASLMPPDRVSYGNRWSTCTSRQPSSHALGG